MMWPLAGYLALFAGTAATMLVAGIHVTKAAEQIAAASRYGRGWVGFLLLSAVTSLPEAVTGISSVGAYDLPNIAVGDALGSLQANLLILSVASLAYVAAVPRDIMWHRTSTTALIGLLAVLLAIFAFGRHTAWVAGVGLATPLLLLAHPALARFQMRRLRNPGLERHPVVPGAWMRFAIASGFVVCAGLLLPLAARGIADGAGLGRTVVGTLIVAAATSLPEAVVTIAAFRQGSVDLAVSDILGSNTFDLFLIGVEDIIYPHGPLLAAVEPLHGYTIAGAVLLHAITLWALGQRNQLMGGRAWLVVAGYLGVQAVFLWRAAA